MKLCWKARSNVTTTIKTVLTNFIIRACVLCCYEESGGGGGGGGGDNNGGGDFDSEYREERQSCQCSVRNSNLYVSDEHSPHLLSFSVCLMISQLPFPKQVPHTVRSSAPSFNLQYPHVSLRSSSSCLTSPSSSSRHFYPSLYLSFNSVF